jgi:hypothetical protein
MKKQLITFIAALGMVSAGFGATAPTTKTVTLDCPPQLNKTFQPWSFPSNPSVKFHGTVWYVGYPFSSKHPVTVDGFSTNNGAYAHFLPPFPDSAIVPYCGVGSAKNPVVVMYANPCGNKKSCSIKTKGSSQWVVTWQSSSNANK